MTLFSRRMLVVALFLASVVLLGRSERGFAQKQPAPGTPNPQAPTLKMSGPVGMQRGTTLDLTLTGTNLNEPVSLWTSFPAKITFPTEANNGKDPAKLTVRLEIPKDAPIGFHAIRLATTRGMSNLRIFCIDDLPQILENGANNTKETAQPVAVPSVIVGKCDAEKSDYYKIQVTAKQRISFEVLGRRLGSAFDPQITLFDAKTGRELPAGHNNDAPGLQTDCRLTYTFKEAGDVVIEIRDVTYRGGDDFIYRLRIGDFPCATSPMPMAAKRGSKVSVHFEGPTVDGVVPVEVTMPTDPAVDSVCVTPKGANGLLGWPVALLASDHDEIVESEPNNDPMHANRVPVPGGVSARFQEKGDIDHFVFTAKKGQRYIIDGHAQELYSPAELYLVLRNAKGTQLQASNPMNAPRIDFMATADEDLTLAVEHLHYWGGPTECYRISIVPYQPGFDLSLGPRPFRRQARRDGRYPGFGNAARLQWADRAKRRWARRSIRPRNDRSWCAETTRSAGDDADRQSGRRHPSRRSCIPDSGQGDHKRPSRHPLRQRPNPGEPRPCCTADSSADYVHADRPRRD